MLAALGYEKTFIDKVCYLVGHHHTYGNIDTLPYRILVEADFLVNLYEDDSTAVRQTQAYDKIFRTNTRKKSAENNVPHTLKLYSFTIVL